MDLESVICEIYVTEKNKYHIIWITCDKKKKLQMNKYNTTKISVIDKEEKDGMGLRDGWNRWRGTTFHCRINESWRWNVHGWNISSNNVLCLYDDQGGQEYKLPVISLNNY